MQNSYFGEFFNLDNGYTTGRNFMKRTRHCIFGCSTIWGEMSQGQSDTSMPNKISLFRFITEMWSVNNLRLKIVALLGESEVLAYFLITIFLY